jgi:hypothetical protein
MNKIIILLVLALFSISCEEKTSCTEQINPDCACTEQYEPVCGCNEVTYGNSCHASCNSIEVVSNGPCVYDIKPLAGKWTFLGYESEGAKFKSDKKTHIYDMFINFESEKIEDKYKMSGKSSINFIGGEYNIVNKGQLYAFINQTTKIAGNDKDLTYEANYIDNVSAANEYEIDGNYLKLTVIDYSQPSIKADYLIFVKD